MLQKLSFTFHHYQFIAKKNLSGLYLRRTCSVPSPLTGTSDRESTALVRSKCIPGVTETGHNTIKKIKELSTQNDANERKNHRKRVEEIYFPYICAVTETSN